MRQLLFLLLFLTFNTFSQSFKQVDAKVSNYPRFSRVENLANQIEKDFTSDIDKVRAAFFWLTKNIRYNIKEFYNPRQRTYSFSYSSEEEKNKKLQFLKDELVANTFSNKTGVCEEYAQSLKKICDLLNIESEVIKGYVRNDASEIGNILYATNHAWNAVKIDKKWILLDATWAAGYEYNGKWIREFNDYFFNIPKSKIFKTHFPEDSIWALRFGRISLDEFSEQPIFKSIFLKNNIELISPNSGIIKTKSLEKITFHFKNLKTPIYYLLEGTKFLKKPKTSKKGNITEVKIINPRKNTTLIFFINEKNAIKFKLLK